MSDSTTLMGKNEAAERIRRGNDSTSGRVPVNHNYYAEDEHRSHKKKKSHKKHKDENREHYAIGGAAKVRQKFPFTRDV